MILAEIELENFRNHKKRTIELSESVSVLLGPNATGKTNILEAIFLLATGGSFKAKRIEEMVEFGAEHGKVGAVVMEGEKMKLEIVLTRGVMQGKRVAKRRYFVNDVAKRKADFVGFLPSVCFRPEDLDLMDGSPSLRREWLDQVLVQADREYARSLISYEQTLRRRNRILDAIREGVASRYQLTFWDGLLIRHGQRMSEGREYLVNYVNEIWRRSELFNHLKLEYDKSVISEKRLEEYKNEEVAAGYTLVGPHKDDFAVRDTEGEADRDLSLYGSRGEKRMAVLGLKMGELLFLEEKLGKKPLLLLDDIFSELDEKHGEEVRRVMIGRQVIVSTTEAKELKGVEGVKIFKLGEGEK